jgi:hypothetical protein
VAQSGSVPEWGSGGPGFKSPRPDHLSPLGIIDLHGSRKQGPSIHSGGLSASCGCILGLPSEPSASRGCVLGLRGGHSASRGCLLSLRSASTAGCNCLFQAKHRVHGRPSERLQAQKRGLGGSSERFCGWKPAHGHPWSRRRRTNHNPQVDEIRGTNTSKRLPFDGSLHTLMKPPRSWTTSRTFANPRPVPVSLVVKNGSKSFALTVPSIP